MKRVCILLCAIVCTTLAGCNAYMVDARVIKPAVDKLVARHDAYVNNDASLQDIQKEVNLLTSKNLKALVDAAAKE